jgi:hypothetical protein
LCISIYLTS